ncbi:BZ3500_MvSof-1268-A1-R1_Chr6-1g08399 [Microbotryum saponariae]|uniref:BZ3500_MvSof-1268-A1-R1_Chr6-1g08399 protein n=1 Tax=Microbotryum saponariae TaxID=289078 RepID=A0A2X0M6I9_9BASI|nr:BZ3500_MvSof-1268-A1-R1_Chr6-1g08399 [Microbotryum saponariae]SDA07683.1 BZ3501_MvSof-1269-A2-R1_Chr6-1g08120 [Microbotryum saponariae]
MVQKSSSSSSASTAAPRRSSRASTPTARALSPGSTPPPVPSIASTLAPPSASGRKPSSSSSASGRGPSPKPRSKTASGTPSGRANSPASAGAKTRPPLPLSDKNDLLLEAKAKLHKVKTQTLHLGPPTNDTIVIARVKCPVPKGVPGHLIKRFDTNAISASSFFRAAFPTASVAAESAEMKYIVAHPRQFGNTKVAGREDDEAHRLSGTWIPCDKALALAEEYGLTKFATDLVNYEQNATSDAAADHSEADILLLLILQSPALRSPRSKRARVQSPRTAAASPTPKSALSGSSANGVSILQTLSTDAKTGVTTETTEVKVDVPVSDAAEASSNGLVASDEAVAAQIAQAQQLVKDLKASGTLAKLTQDTTIPSSSVAKRAYEEDEDELPQTGTLADALRDDRGFFGKLFRRRPNGGRRVPVNAGREIRAAPAQLALVQREEAEGRRWVAGFGLALATAAAPYLFG